MSEKNVAAHAVLAVLTTLVFFALFSILRLIRGEFSILSSLLASLVLGVIAFVFFYIKTPLS